MFQRASRVLWALPVFLEDLRSHSTMFMVDFSFYNLFRSIGLLLTKIELAIQRLRNRKTCRWRDAWWRRVSTQTMPSSSFCYRRHQSHGLVLALVIPCLTDCLGHFLVVLKVGVPIGMERERSNCTTLSRSSNLFWVMLFFTVQPPDLHLAPRWISVMRENTPVQWCE